MSNAIVTEFTATKKLLAWGEYAARHGLDLSVDLQPSLDDPAMMKCIVHCIQKTAQLMRAQHVSSLPFGETGSQRMAREILGLDFLGVHAAQQTFGAYTEAELRARWDIPFSEQTLWECKGDFILMCTHNMDLNEVHAAHSVRFNDDRFDTWFGKPDQREKWSAQKIASPWILVRKHILPKSSQKSIDVHRAYIDKFPKERLITPAEFAYAALRLLFETGSELCSGYNIRFLIETAKGRWVRAGWVGHKLNFNHWDGSSSGNVALASVRVS